MSQQILSTETWAIIIRYLVLSRKGHDNGIASASHQMKVLWWSYRSEISRNTHDEIIALEGYLSDIAPYPWSTEGQVRRMPLAEQSWAKIMRYLVLLRESHDNGIASASHQMNVLWRSYQSEIY